MHSRGCMRSWLVRGYHGLLAYRLVGLLRMILCAQAAAASSPGNAESQKLAASDPMQWWSAHGGEGQLGYSSALAFAAPSQTARQGLLKKYFEPSEEDQEEGGKYPTAAHSAIARLVKQGWVRVVLTTNFDRLIEQALDAEHVPHRVVSRPETVASMLPLAHLPVHVVKIHGDWADPESCNTDDELAKYPRPWRKLLKQVFGEYGLLISGWSGEWDHALVGLLESTRRRYPLYWDRRSCDSPTAKRLLNHLGGHIVESESADELFTNLFASVEALQRLAEPPLTTAIAVARLKRALLDPVKRIEVHDLVMGRVDTVLHAIRNIPDNVDENHVRAAFDATLDDLFEASKPLLVLLVHIVRYDDGSHMKLLTDVLERLMDARRKRLSVSWLDALQHYPAHLALRSMSVEAVRNRRDDALINLLTRPRWNDPDNHQNTSWTAYVLNQDSVIASTVIDGGNPRWSDQAWDYSVSKLMTRVLRDFFVDWGVDSGYEELCKDVEYRTGFVQYLGLTTADEGDRARDVRFYWYRRWDSDSRDRAEKRFRDSSKINGHSAWEDILGDRQLDGATTQFHGALQESYNSARRPG